MEEFIIKSRIISIISIMVLVALLLGSASITAFETTPKDGETDFPINGKIIIEFDDPMDIGSVAVDITPDPIYHVEKIWSNDDRTLTLKPSVNLLENKNYTIQIKGDYQNASLGSVDETFSFTTEKEESTENDKVESYIPLILLVIVVIIIIVVLLFLIIGKKKSSMN